MSDMRYDVFIIGSGISGRWMAWLLAQKGYSVALCESEKRLGGSSRIDRLHFLRRNVYYLRDKKTKISPIPLV